jgi:hypothetical protein
MAPRVSEQLTSSNIGIMRERFLVDIPKADLMFFQLFADKMGWQFKSKQSLWDEYIANSPKNIALTEEEIMEEVRAVRYGKVQDNH